MGLEECKVNPRGRGAFSIGLGNLQRKRAHHRKGSSRRRQLSQRIAAIHEKIEHKRLDHDRKLTTPMVEECSVIAAEKLNAENMSRSPRGTVDDPGRDVGTHRIWSTADNKTTFLEQSEFGGIYLDEHELPRTMLRHDGGFAGPRDGLACLRRDRRRAIPRRDSARPGGARICVEQAVDRGVAIPARRESAL